MATDDGKSDGEIRKLQRQIQDLREELKQQRDDEMVGTQEAAKILGMSLPALRQAVLRGKIPVVRISPRVLRYRRGDLVGRTRK